MNHQEKIEYMIENTDSDLQQAIIVRNQQAIIVRNQLVKGLINREEANLRLNKYGLMI